MVVRAAFTVHVLMLSNFGTMVVRAAFAVHVFVLVLCSVVMRAAFTMNMLVGRFLREGRRIRQRGNKA